jgi:hypothetical protein
MRAILFAALAAVSAVAGCGGSGNQTCCYTGYYYSCPDNNTAGECAAGQVVGNGCTRDSSKDTLCQKQ